MTNSKNKGNSFERKIAKLLSERFSEYTGLKSAFSRNPDSGSFFGGMNETRITTHGTEHARFGDIVCPSDFKFIIECKHYKNPPSLKSFLNQDIKDWDDWLEQAEQDAKNSNKNLLLVIKYNRVNEIILTSLDLSVTNKYKGYSVMSLEDFLKNPDELFFG